MVDRSKLPNAFEFVTVASARAKQLMRGCTPRVEASADAKKARVAQREVETGSVQALEPDTPPQE